MPPTGARLAAPAVPRAPRSPSAGRGWRIAFAIALVVGTLLGVSLTSALALVLAAPRLLSTGLEPRPEGAALRWLVSPAVAGPLTTALLWLLALATLLLAVAIVAAPRRATLWRAYVAWAVVGGLLTSYALVSNWQLAREVGLLALGVGGVWSALVALGVARVARVARRYAAARHDPPRSVPS